MGARGGVIEGVHEYANSIDENIKIELRWDYRQIEFLDTMVKNKDDWISTDLYVKPTDRHIYVHEKSSHSNSVKRAIPYGLAIRLKRICSEESDYQRHKLELKQQLRKRGYSGKSIERQLRKADVIPREDTLAEKPQQKRNKRVTYGAHLPDVSTIIKQRMNILHRSARMKEVFEEPPLLSFRRDRNIGVLLIHEKLNKIMSQSHVKQCKVCPILDGDGTVKSLKNNKEFRVKKGQGCQT